MLLCIVDSYDCNLNIQAYSSIGPSTPEIGYVRVNGRSVWDAGIYAAGLVNERGVNTIIINPSDCTASDIRSFDTYVSQDNASDLVAYLKYLHAGTLVIGVTGDEPRGELDHALVSLRAAGIYVDDVKPWGRFAFVIQIGYPQKTQFVKAIDNTGNLPVSQLNVTITGRHTFLVTD